MAYIRSKLKKGNRYYSIVESRRDGPDGAPRQHTLEYIGPERKLLEAAMRWREQALAGAVAPEKVSFKSYEYGASAALWKAAGLVGLEQNLDDVLGVRTIRGMNRGRVLVLATLCHAIAPDSHVALSDWCETTSLPYHLGFDASDLDAQVLWEAMDGIGADEAESAWRSVASRLRSTFPEGLGSPGRAHDFRAISVRGQDERERDEACSRSVRPRWHRVEGRVSVQTLLSRCAVMLTEVLRSLLDESAGIRLTRRALLEGLAQIRDGFVIVDGRRKRTVEDLAERERRLWDAVVVLPGETLGVDARRQ